MKKIILIVCLSFAMTCEQVAFTNTAIDRCENDEVVCYIKFGIGGGISCFEKGANNAK